MNERLVSSPSFLQEDPEHDGWLLLLKMPSGHIQRLGRELTFSPAQTHGQPGTEAADLLARLPVGGLPMDEGE